MNWLEFLGSGLMTNMYLFLVCICIYAVGKALKEKLNEVEERLSQILDTLEEK